MQLPMDDNDTVYVNSGGGQSTEQLILLESRSIGLNVDLAEIRKSREMGLDSGYDDAAARMNSTWHQSMPVQVMSNNYKVHGSLAARGDSPSTITASVLS